MPSLALGTLAALALLEAAPRPAATPPPLRLEGVVKDAAGKPVDKALVLAHLHDRTGGRTLATRSDATGAFTLPLDPPGDDALRVEAAGLAPYTADHVTVPKGGLTVTLRAGGSIEGVVKDARGRPVAGARVTSRDYGGSWGPGAFDPTAGRVRTTTDPRGAFRLRG